jgi:flagellar biosynthetic protein FliR
VELYALQLVLFLLLFLRCTSLIATAPVVGHVAVPTQVKVGLGAFLALVLYPLVAARAPVMDLRLLPMALLAVQEVLVGVILGWAAGLVFAGVRAAGELIGFELGFSIATVFDPEQGQQNIVGGFLYLVMSLVWFSVNGHHFLLQAMMVSYDVVPIDGLSVTGPAALMVTKMTAMVFVVALKFAAPVIVASFLVNLAMAILSRVAPQINVFVVSFPLKTAVGFVVLMTSAPLLVLVFKKLLGGFEEQMLELMKAL